MGFRKWTNSAGRTMEAVLVGFQSGTVSVRTQEGRVYQLPLDQLAKTDQDFVRSQTPEIITKNAQLAASLAPVYASNTWPLAVTVHDGITHAAYLQRESKPGEYVYATKHFRYTMHTYEQMDATKMMPLARLFEGTYQLLSLSPFGVQALPKNGLYEAHFYPDQGAYYNAGGPFESGGVYQIKQQVFLLPFTTLGLDPKKDVYAKDDSRQVRTLVHELTHMMMHDILKLIPMWLAEGSAEYTSLIPFNNGTFDCTGIHQAMRKKFSSVNHYPLNELVVLSPRQWHQAAEGQEVTPDLVPGEVKDQPPSLPPANRLAHIITTIPTSLPPTPLPPTNPANSLPGNIIKPLSDNGFTPPTRLIPQLPKIDQRPALYSSSLLLTYYFMHLDGDRKGSRLLRFLNACRAERTVQKEYEALVAIYRNEMNEFIKRPEVRSLPDGVIQYPSNLTPPKYPAGPKPEYAKGRGDFVHINLLLDGRSVDQLADEATQALGACFKAKAVKLEPLR